VIDTLWFLYRILLPGVLLGAALAWAAAQAIL